MTLGVGSLLFIMGQKGYKSITGGVLYRLIQSPNRTIIQCLTWPLAVKVKTYFQLDYIDVNMCLQGCLWHRICR
jgi:hypothetical protein